MPGPMLADMPRVVRWGGALLVVLALGSCGGGDDPVTEVLMLDNSYSPAVVEVEVGDTVRFVNRGRVQHDAIDVGGAWKTDLLDADDAQEVTFNDEGTYDFFEEDEDDLLAKIKAAGDMLELAGTQMQFLMAG